MNANVTKTNGVKLFALVAVLAMVFAGAAVMMDDGVDAANDTTYISGQITASQTFEAGTNVVVNDNLEIPADKVLIIRGNFTVNEGSTITIKAGGQLVFDGDKAIVTINGNIVAEGIKASESSIINNVVYVNSGEKVTSSVTLNGNITLEKGAKITTGNETIAVSGSAVSLTVPASSANADIIIGNSGVLDVNKRSSSVSVIADQDIMMYVGATFTTEGYSQDVTISAMSNARYYTTGSVDLTYTGTKDANNRDTSNLTFTVTTQNISAYTAASNGTRVTVQQCIVNVDGTLDGQAAASNGTPAASNDVLTFKGASDITYYQVKDDGTVSADKIKPVFGSISGTLNVAENGNIVFDETANVIVSGTLDFSSEASSSDSGADATNSMKLNGTILVTGTINADWIDASAADKDSIISTAKDTTYFKIDGGKVTITGVDLEGLFDFFNANAYGAAYTAKVNNVNTTYICDFDVAVTEAAAADSDVYIFGYNASVGTDAEDAVEKGAYLIDTNVTIPDGMVLYGNYGMVVAENAALTFANGSDFTNATGSTMIFVLGKVVDEEGIFDSDDSQIKYEVKKLSEDESVATYTTLAIALGEAQPGESIELNGTVTISKDTTIPADVTVVTDATPDKTYALIVEGATLTINGTLEISGTNTVQIKNDPDNAEVAGKIVLNNVIKNAVYDASTGTFVGNDGSTKIYIPGAYFNAQLADDDAPVDYVTSVAFAAANSAETDTINIYGKVSMGDVTFTQGENALSGLDVILKGADKEDITAGTITLVGDDVEFNMADVKSFTGKVTSEVTAGASTVDFNKASGNTITISGFDDGETVTTTMTLNGTLTGAATVSAGEVTAGAALTMNDYTTGGNVKSVLTVGTGATLNVVNGSSLSVVKGTDGKSENYSALVIDGTLNVSGTTSNMSISSNGSIDIAGTMNIGKDLTLAGTLYVTGTLAVSETEGEESTLTVDIIYAGDKDGAAGTVTGAITLDDNKGFVAAYPAADVSGAAIDETDGESSANTTVFYINGEVFLTAYSAGTVTVGDILGSSPIEMVGYEDVVLGATADATRSDWYKTEDMAADSKVYATTEIDDQITALYAKAEVSQALVYVSVGSNMTVYIDDVRYSNGAIFALDVGQHTISVQVNAGYTGETSVLVGGTAVTGGTFEITPQMAEDYSVPTNIDSASSTDCVVISVTGSIAIDTGATGGDGMGLTEILLVILVILIVVMAIMVALRLMRS